MGSPTDPIVVKMKDGISQMEITREELLECNAYINRLEAIEKAARDLLRDLLLADNEPCPACVFWTYPYEHYDYCTLQALKNLLEKKT